MTTRNDSSRSSQSQWPVFAGLWSLYLVLLGLVLWRVGGPAPLSLGQKVAVGLFLIFFTLAEMGLLVLLNALFEHATRNLRSKVLLDACKAFGLALTLTVLTASLLKFLTARAHLRITDFWFVVTNFRQLRQESLGTELSSAAWMGGGFLVVFGGLFLALRALRHRGPRASVPSFAVLAAVALLGAGLSWVRYDTVPTFARFLVPEINWLTRTSVSELRGPGADGTSKGPPILPYEPPKIEHHGSGDDTGPGPGGLDTAVHAENVLRAENVVLIMLESIPWSRLSFTDAPPGVTPNLDRLARESVVFSRAYATSVHSDYAQMSILSSLFPRKFNHHDYYQELDYPRTLIWDALRPAGWSTAMFSCQNEAWGNMLAFLRTPGLERMMHSPDFPPEVPRKGRGTESKVFEEAVVEAWRSWLVTEEAALAETPFFVYLNFQSNHFPYGIPPEAPRPFAPYEIDFPASFLGFPLEKVPVMENRFYNALAYADHWVGEVRRTLEERGDWERTALIVVSDHGEAFYEHRQPTHGTAVYEEQVRSVWMMRLPGEEPRWIEEPVSLLDLAPTLLRYLGLPPHGNFQGRGDVLSPEYTATGRPLFFTIQGMTFEDGLLLDGWKYWINWDRQVHRLFHLPDDPEERNDLLEEELETVQRLQSLLLGFLGAQLAYYEEKGWEDGVYPPRLP